MLPIKLLLLLDAYRYELLQNRKLRLNKANQPLEKAYSSFNYFYYSFYKNLILMQTLEQRRSNLFTRRIVITRNRKNNNNRTVMPLSKLEILSDNHQLDTLRDTQKFYQNKLDKQLKYKKSQRTTWRSFVKSTHQLSSHDREDKAHNKLWSNLRDIEHSQSQTKHLIFSTEIEDMIRTIQHKRSANRPRKFLKSPHQPKLTITNLNYSFKLSNYCKQSLKEISLQSRFQKWESLCTSMSYRAKSDDKKEVKQLKSLRTTLKPQYRSIEPRTEKRDQLNGWEVTAARYQTEYQSSFNDIY